MGRPAGSARLGSLSGRLAAVRPGRPGRDPPAGRALLISLQQAVNGQRCGRAVPVSRRGNCTGTQHRGNGVQPPPAGHDSGSECTPPRAAPMVSG